jgi:membrane protease subunit (stomatin/prohibitin family)
MAPIKKWPFPGQTLPVTVDRADPTRIKVRWDDMPEAGDVAKQQADALAAQMNQGGGVAPGITGAGAADVNQIVEALQQSMPGAQVNVGGAAGAGASQDDGEDRVAQLERLTKLRDSGALSEQEFEREKARILAQ